MVRLSAARRVVVPVALSLLLVSCKGLPFGAKKTAPPQQSSTQASKPSVKKPTPAQQKVVEVTISANKFSPAVLKVSKGATVRWINKDPVGHQIIGDKPESGLSGPVLRTGDSFVHVFTAPGTVNYHCAIHKTMKGTVEVAK